MLRYDYADVTQRDVATLFGADFAAQLFRLPTGAWRGPVQSSYGIHLVRIASRRDAPAPDYEALRDKVRTAWLDDARKRANAEILANVKARYRISVAEPFATSGAARTPGVARPGE
jgi:parvulin-like peptidyl-prolyl isomerase